MTAKMETELLELGTQRSAGLWASFAAATLLEWLDDRDGAWTVRPTGAGYWIERTGALAEDEVAALRTLAGPGDSLSHDGHRVMQLAREWAPGVGASGELPAVSAALDRLGMRAREVFDQAEPMLAAWEAFVPAATPPSWFEWERKALARIMGGVGSRATRLVLLPSSPDRNGTLWGAFIGRGLKGIQCGGQPCAPDVLWEDWLHSAAHAAQGVRLEPLMERYLETPHGQRMDAACQETPYAAWLKTIPSVGPSAIRDVVRETVIHGLVYQGALRTAGRVSPLDDYWRQIADSARDLLSQRDQKDERGTPYTAWVLGGCAALQPNLQRYLDEGRTLDGELVAAVFENFEALYDRWKSA